MTECKVRLAKVKKERMKCCFEKIDKHNRRLICFIEQINLNKAIVMFCNFNYNFNDFYISKENTILVSDIEAIKEDILKNEYNEKELDKFFEDYIHPTIIHYRSKHNVKNAKQLDFHRYKEYYY